MENESKYARKQRLLAQGAIGTEYKIEETPIIPDINEVAIKKNEEKIRCLERKMAQMNELISIGKRKAQIFIDMGSTKLADKQVKKIVEYEKHLLGMQRGIEKSKLKIENINNNLKKL